MNTFKKFFSVFSSFFLLQTFFTTQAQAVCPVCAVAVGAGVGVSRYFGIDDIVTGIWVGGLTVSFIMWTIDWLTKKNIKFPLLKIITTVVFYALIVIPLYTTGIMEKAGSQIWGLDKLLVGVGVGSVGFLLGAIWYEQLKKMNNDKAYFPFQKVVMPVSSLVILSVLFYILDRI